MAEKEQDCPYQLILEFIEGPGLRASIKNISERLHAFICEDYWHGTSITIWNEKCEELIWENVYPP